MRPTAAIMGTPEYAEQVAATKGPDHGAIGQPRPQSPTPERW